MLRPWTAAMFAICASGTALADEPCKPDAKKLVPKGEQLAKLCPKDPLFKGARSESDNGQGGCLVSWDLASDGSISISATDQHMSGGAKAAADASAKALGGKATVKKAAFRSLEAYEVTGLPGYYVGAGKTVLSVSVSAVMSKPLSAACTEAIVKEVARRAGD